ncbi:hypothetical protein [[Acholeplasma] multilocale]|uniref:hypothetical protein n=1 Tax=[Acholeplasma] multilocale TaxID=264638 RepID=UPI000479DB35|nr:hypothetical protein [[Acholeplasma] multilocale]
MNKFWIIFGSLGLVTGVAGGVTATVIAIDSKNKNPQETLPEIPTVPNFVQHLPKQLSIPFNDNFYINKELESILDSFQIPYLITSTNLISQAKALDVDQYLFEVEEITNDTPSVVERKLVVTQHSSQERNGEIVFIDNGYKANLTVTISTGDPLDVLLEDLNWDDKVFEDGTTAEQITTIVNSELTDFLSKELLSNITIVVHMPQDTESGFALIAPINNSEIVSGLKILSFRILRN